MHVSSFLCLSCSSWESAGKQWLMAGRACGLPGPTAHRPLIWLLSLWNWGIGRNEKSEKRAKERIENHGTLSLCGSDATSADLRLPPLRVGDEEELRRALLCLYALKLPWIRDIGVHSIFSFKFLMQRNATERTTLAWTRHDCVSMFIKISKTFFVFFLKMHHNWKYRFHDASFISFRTLINHQNWNCFKCHFDIWDQIPHFLFLFVFSCDIQAAGTIRHADDTQTNPKSENYLNSFPSRVCVSLYVAQSVAWREFCTK